MKALPVLDPRAAATAALLKRFNHKIPADIGAKPLLCWGSFSFQPRAWLSRPREGPERRLKAHSAEDRQTLGEEVLRALRAAEADGPISMPDLGEPMAACNSNFAHKTSIMGFLDGFGSKYHFQLHSSWRRLCACRMASFDPCWSAGFFILRNLAQSAHGSFSVLDTPPHLRPGLASGLRFSAMLAAVGRAFSWPGGQGTGPVLEQTSSGRQDCTSKRCCHDG